MTAQAIRLVEEVVFIVILQWTRALLSRPFRMAPDNHLESR
jgi:hypothetical protein